MLWELWFFVRIEPGRDVVKRPLNRVSLVLLGLVFGVSCVLSYVFLCLFWTQLFNMLVFIIKFVKIRKNFPLIYIIHSIYIYIYGKTMILGVGGLPCQ